VNDAELGRRLAARDVDVAELVARAESDARAEVAETLKRLFVDDLLERALAALEPSPPSLGLVGVVEEEGHVVPLVQALDPASLGDTAALEAAARAHNDLLLDRGPVVPFRFGTAFPTRDALDGWLREHEYELLAELERLRGAVEWGVEVLAAEPQPRGDEQSGYLEQRLAAGIATADRTRLAATCRDRLAEAALDAAGDAYLVADQQAFDSVLAELGSEGVALRVTGPWPPYSFARLPAT
jgi:gas vesicle protein GvpL/GvpF